MGWLAVCTSFGEEYASIQTRMASPQEMSYKHVRATRGFFQDVPIELLLMGVGQKGIEKLCALEWGEYNGFLHLGYCGGLTPKLKVGDLVMPSRCLNGLGEAAEIEGLNLVLKSPHGVHSGTMVTVDFLARDHAQKTKLHREFGAEAVDMESYELVKRALEGGLSTIILKAVADGVSDDLPPFGNDFEPGAAKENIAAATRAEPELARRWRENMLIARESLAQGASQLIPALHQIWSF
ncbi:MAG TPA: hypothetical protein VFV50_11990 [Bdellovibrionales bacterium]|nr:hypothetical protein [Bdellovibrionales bacterium]